MNRNITAEQLDQLHAEMTPLYPEQCQSCERVAAIITAIAVRGSKTIEQARSLIKEDVARTNRAECKGQVPTADPGCFAAETECYLQSEAYIDSQTVISN